MTVVKINAISVPDGAGPELERRFAKRPRELEHMDGFLRFELLRPVSGEQRYFVVTHWASEEAFRSWVDSDAFRHAHARAESPDGVPVAMHAELLSFEVVQSSLPAAGSDDEGAAPSPHPAATEDLLR